jgi:cyanate permease
MKEKLFTKVSNFHLLIIGIIFLFVGNLVRSKGGDTLIIGDGINIAGDIFFLVAFINLLIAGIKRLFHKKKKEAPNILKR